MTAPPRSEANALQQPSVRWLLLLVLLMAAACATALWLTLQQARQLGQPRQHADLWYVSSVSSELAQVRLLSHQLLSGEVPSEELHLRMEVLYSVLNNSATAPLLSGQHQGQLAGTAGTLQELTQRVDTWLRALDAGPSTHGERVARDVLRSADELHRRVRMSVAEVHVAASEHNDASRQSLQQRFVALSLVLVGLLSGTAALIWHLMRDMRRARHVSLKLAQSNQLLETRVIERTRQIEDARLLLNFILDASPSDVLLIGASDSHVIFINQGLVDRLQLNGHPERLPLTDFLHEPEHRRSVEEGLERYGEVGGLEVLIGRDPPTWCSLSARLIEVDGRLGHLFWSFDITPHKRLEARLRELATTDPLSGLDNRRAFLQKSVALLEHCRRHQQDCAMLMLDIDRFKSINDHHGHAVGDQAIIACANAMRATLRDADVLGRMGGEEFAALLPLANAQAAADTAERLRLAVEALQIRLDDGATLRLTVSIGVTRLGGRSASVEDLLIEADEALYQAKSDGRNRVVSHPPTANALTVIHPSTSLP